MCIHTYQKISAPPLWQRTKAAPVSNTVFIVFSIKIRRRRENIYLNFFSAGIVDENKSYNFVGFVLACLRQ